MSLFISERLRNGVRKRRHFLVSHCFFVCPQVWGSPRWWFLTCSAPTTMCSWPGLSTTCFIRSAPHCHGNPATTRGMQLATVPLVFLAMRRIYNQPVSNSLSEWQISFVYWVRPAQSVQRQFRRSGWRFSACSVFSFIWLHFNATSNLGRNGNLLLVIYMILYLDSLLYILLIQ